MIRSINLKQIFCFYQKNMKEHVNNYKLNPIVIHQYKQNNLIIYCNIFLFSYIKLLYKVHDIYNLILVYNMNIHK